MVHAHRLILGSLVLLSVFTLTGCATTEEEVDVSGDYRTVRADPLRNTQAAVEANQEGLAHMDAGEWELAADAFSRALLNDVEYGPAHNNLGKVYYYQQNWYNAAWEFQYAIKLMPRRAEPLNNLGLVLEQSNDYDRAIDQYRAAVSADPKNIVYRANLARAMIRRGDRSDEVQGLLIQILDEDTRPEWLIWAKQQLARY